MYISFSPTAGHDHDEESTQETGNVFIEAGRYEKDPELDLALVGDDTIMPDRIL